MIKLYHDTSFAISKKMTNAYSTSFSLGIRAFAKEYREPIYAIYGFVRLADEIVDSFHDFNKAELIKQFRNDTFEAIDKGISTNPILHSFQKIVNEYKIDHQLLMRFSLVWKWILTNLPIKEIYTINIFTALRK